MEGISQIPQGIYIAGAVSLKIQQNQGKRIETVVRNTVLANFYLLSAHRQRLYGTPPLWRGFRDTKKLS